MRKIAEDPQGFILRQGWASLDFADTEQLAQSRRLWESIELEIVRVLEALNALKESPYYELHRLTTRSPTFFDDTVRRHIASLEVEIAGLTGEAAELEREIAASCSASLPRMIVCAVFQFPLMIGVKSLQFSILNPRMSRTTFGNQSNAFRASSAAKRFAISSFSVTYTLP